MLTNTLKYVPFSEQLDISLELASGRRVRFLVKGIEVTTHSEAAAKYLVDHIIRNWKSDNLHNPMTDEEMLEAKRELFSAFLELWKLR